MTKIVDTTLRDGEQTPGVSFDINEKITIAKMLNAAGVHYIEAGTPAMGHEEKIAVKEIIDLDLKSKSSHGTGRKKATSTIRLKSARKTSICHCPYPT